MKNKKGNINEHWIKTYNENNNKNKHTNKHNKTITKHENKTCKNKIETKVGIKNTITIKNKT